MKQRRHSRNDGRIVKGTAIRIRPEVYDALCALAGEYKRSIGLTAGVIIEQVLAAELCVNVALTAQVALEDDIKTSTMQS